MRKRSEDREDFRKQIMLALDEQKRMNEISK